MVSRYEVIISWSDADDAFIGWVSELPGCMAHGDTREDALYRVEEAMALWLAVAREFGDPAPAPHCGPPVAAWERPRCDFGDGVALTVADTAAAPATVPVG